jgi:transcriptional regulator ATRX
VIGDATTGYIVNVAREKGEEAVRIPPSLSSKLKAHQVPFYPCAVSHTSV